MKRNRQTKVLAIIALLITICGMSFGFAAFSATLNISSSATVTPNSDDFKIKVYGFENLENFEMFMFEWVENNNILESLWSDKNAIAYIPEGYEDSTSADLATIDNSSLSIDNMNVTFSKPIGDNAVQYMFFLKNEGQYTAYLDEEEFKKQVSINYSCDVLSEESAFDTQFVCDYMGIGFQFVSSDFTPLTDGIIIAPDDFILITYEWKYSSLYVDSPVLVRFENFKFPFTTKPQS